MNLPDHIHPIAVDDALLNIGMTINEIRALTGDTTPTIIRTVEELEALESEAIVQRHPQHPGQYSYPETASDLAYVVQRWGTDRYLPAVVVAPAAQVRAARKALGGSDAAR